MVDTRLRHQDGVGLKIKRLSGIHDRNTYFCGNQLLVIEHKFPLFLIDTKIIMTQVVHTEQSIDPAG